MFRILIFASKKPGLSREEFIETYESSHLAIVKDLLTSGVHAPMPLYRRNYLVKADPLTTQGPNLPSFDVVVEAEFEDRKSFEDTIKKIDADPASALRVKEDFLKFFDLSTLCYTVVEPRSGGGAL